MVVVAPAAAGGVLQECVFHHKLSARQQVPASQVPSRSRGAATCGTWVSEKGDNPKAPSAPWDLLLRCRCGRMNDWG